MIINHNMGAINAHRQMISNTTTTQKSTEKLSSGLRINRAGDDAAGLAISEKMRGQIRGLDQSTRNAQDGISLIQTAEGALNETHSILQRMRELSVQSANDTNTDADRAELQKEVTQLQSEIDRISTDTEFNTKKLLNGTLGANASSNNAKSTLLDIAGVAKINNISLKAGAAGAEETYSIVTTGNDVQLKDNGGTVIGKVAKADVKALEGKGGTLTFKDDNGKSLLSLDVTSAITEGSFGTAKNVVISGKDINFQIGANSGQSMSLSIGDTSAATLGVDGTKVDISTAKGAQDAITAIDSAITSVSATRSNLGAVQNRLEHTINNLGTSSENLTAAESRIRDVDMAKEMMNLTKLNVLTQASQAMLAQANQKPNQVLSLLQ